MQHYIQLFAYANPGPGIAFLLSLFIIGVTSMIWIIVWLPKGFRSHGWRDPHRLRINALIGVLVITTITILFPPLRQIGVWKDTGTNLLIDSRLADEYDRFWFGYIPTYGWIGHVMSRETPDSSVSVSSTSVSIRSYRLVEIEWRIDWIFLAGQIGIIFLGAAPFLAARN
jgi:hypothetical protein